MPAATRWHAEQNKFVLSVVAPENCSSAMRTQKDIWALPRHQGTGPLLDTFTSCAWSAAHSSSESLQDCRTGKTEQKGLSGWWRNPDPLWWECGLNGCCYHRGTSQSYCSTYCLKKKSWLLMFPKASLWERQFCTKTEHAHQLAMAKAGGNKHCFFPELDLTARKKTTFKLYQENKPQFASVLGGIPCSSQGSLVHSVCAKLIQASLPMLDSATHKSEEQGNRGWVSCTCSLCESGAGLRHTHSQHFTTGQSSRFILPNMITQEQLSLAISNNNFKMFSSVSSLNWNDNFFFF